MSHKLLSGATATGHGSIVKLPSDVTDHTVKVDFHHYGTTAVTALTATLQGATKGYDEDHIVSSPACAIGSTAENVANAAFKYRINGTLYSKAAVSAGTALTSGGTIAASKYGAIIMQIDTAGVVTDKVPAAAQSYASAALAAAAGIAVKPDPGHIIWGFIIVQNNGSLWTAGTDSLSDDITAVVFSDAAPIWHDLTTHAFTAAELTAQTAMFHTTNKGVQAVQLNIETLTGNGYINAYYDSYSGV